MNRAEVRAAFIEAARQKYRALETEQIANRPALRLCKSGAFVQACVSIKNEEAGVEVEEGSSE